MKNKTNKKIHILGYLILLLVFQQAESKNVIKEVTAICSLAGLWYTYTYTIVRKCLYLHQDKVQTANKKPQNNANINKAVPQQKTAFSGQTKNQFDDPYNAPTKEEWDAFCKQNQHVKK